MVFKKFFFFCIFSINLQNLYCAIDCEEKIPITAFQESLSDFTQIRRKLHQNPELRFQEMDTANFLKSYLHNLDVDQIIEGVANTGLVVLIDSRKPGKTVALRADMDALPLCEETGLSYTSKILNKMHACGHDGHMSTLLMVIKELCQSRDKFQGKIKCIFQPAEEGGGGADMMIAEGVLENPKVDAIFGFHNWPLKFGCLATKTGTLMAGADQIDIKIKGVSGHAAMPHTTVNPIVVGCHLLNSYQQILFQKNPTQLVVLNFCSFVGGESYNVVPDIVKIKGTLRTDGDLTRIDILEKIQKVTDSCAKGFDIEIKFESTPICCATINTVKETDLVVRVASKILSEDQNVLLLENPVMPGEDFSSYLKIVPGCFFFIGYGENNPSLHSPHYDFNDGIMPIAAYMLANTAINFLNNLN